LGGGGALVAAQRIARRERRGAQMSFGYRNI
jgi:hypothetical protein